MPEENANAGRSEAKCSAHGFQYNFDCPECYSLLADVLSPEDARLFKAHKEAERQSLEIERREPISLEIESVESVAPPAASEPLSIELEDAATPADAERKRDQILKLWESGEVKDVAEIVRRVKARPSYVAQVLQKAGHLEGHLEGHFDLYQMTASETNVYTRFFRNVLAFRNVEAARESVAKIDRLYNYFERLGDRAGQHEACKLALLGKNRARWSGKLEESQIFHDWLVSH